MSVNAKQTAISNLEAFYIPTFAFTWFFWFFAVLSSLGIIAFALPIKPVQRASAFRRRVVLRFGSEGEAQFNKAEKYLVEKYQAYLHELQDIDRQYLAGADDSLLQVVGPILGRTDTNQQAD